MSLQEQFEHSEISVNGIPTACPLLDRFPTDGKQPEIAWALGRRPTISSAGEGVIGLAITGSEPTATCPECNKSQLWYIFSPPESSHD